MWQAYERSGHLVPDDRFDRYRGGYLTGMGTKIEAEFEVKDWDEHQFDIHAGAGKLTRATVTKVYHGGVEGDSVTQWLMAYAADGTATFVGMERIVGTIDGRQGTLVLQHVGAFQNGAAKAELMVVEGACSGEFADAAGTGKFVANPSGRVTLQLALP
jgi:hypothetical protein